MEELIVASPLVVAYVPKEVYQLKLGLEQSCIGKWDLHKHEKCLLYR
jgi:hypothetical protein